VEVGSFKGPEGSLTLKNPAFVHNMKKNDRSVRPDEALVVQPKTKRSCNVAMLEHAFSKYTRRFFAKIGTLAF
jgi:hypothetical protein